MLAVRGHVARLVEALGEPDIWSATFSSGVDVGSDGSGQADSNSSEACGM